MLVIVFVFFFYVFSFNAVYAVGGGSLGGGSLGGGSLGEGGFLYCSDFSLSDLISGGISYKGCYGEPFYGAVSYYRVVFSGKFVRSVERYSGGEFVGVKNFRYLRSRLVIVEDGEVSENRGKRLLSYVYFRVGRDNAFMGTSIDSQINVHNGKSYRISYSRKLEEYDGGELMRVSYYSGTRLLIRLYYEDERITGYKFNRYVKGIFIEEYYEGKDVRFRYYKSGRLLLTHYYPVARGGYYFSIYYYSALGGLLLEERYYVAGSGMKSLQGRIKGVLFSSGSFMGGTLEEQRRFWRKFIRPFVRNEADIFKSYNVDSSGIILDRVSYFRDGLLGLGRGYLKVEYYIDGIIRRLEYFDILGNGSGVEYYNYLGERVFDR